MTTVEDSMSMKKTTSPARALLLFFLAGVLLIASCKAGGTPGVHEEDWTDHGARIGKVVITEQGYGFEYRYFDLENKLLIIEKRNKNKELWNKACTVKFKYDDQKRLLEEASYDKNMCYAMNDQGYALLTYAYGVDSDNNPFTELSFYCADKKPAQTPSGFAVKKITWEGLSKTKLSKIEFFDTEKKRTPVTYENIPATAEVRYKYLDGIGEVCYAVHFGVSGNVLKNRKISGHTQETWMHTTTTYYNTYGNTTYYNTHYNTYYEAQ